MKFNILIFIILLPFFAFSQNPEQDGSKFHEKYQLKVSKSIDEIKIDGLLNEKTWTAAQKIKANWQKWPIDNTLAKRSTEVMVTYDDKYIYFAAICEDTSNYIIQTLKRDTKYFDSDGFAVVLDPVNKRSNGFMFGVNPNNVQSEDLLTSDAFNELNFSWDNKWFSETKRLKDHWIVEMAIPFKTLRFDASNKIWGVNFIRSDVKNNAYNTWTNIPVNFLGYDLGYTGAMILDEAPAKISSNVSIIPFATGGLTTNAEDNSALKGRLNGGLDAKVSVTPSLNLDVTVNPDFSQIEVDRQVTNLTRFNIFLPERRTFFLENDDIFSSYGAPPFRPFYSRTIGLDLNGNAIPILGGLRLSGNATEKLRIGVMNMQTGKRGNFGDDNYASAQNFTSASFNQRIGSRSSAKGYFMNRQGFLDNTEKSQNPLSEYGRNIGMEYNYSNAAGTLNLWGGYHKSFKPTITEKDNFIQLGGGVFQKNFNIFSDFATFGKNYYTDMGFVNRIESFATKGNSYASGDTTMRLGFMQWFTQTEFFYRPKDKKIINHNLSFENYMVFMPDGTLNERQNSISYQISFRNTATFSSSFSPNFTELLFYTPLPSIKPLEPGKYTYNQVSAEYNSDIRKLFSYSLSVQRGGFYNGKISQYVGSVLFRKQPWGNFDLSYEYNQLNFPEEFGDINFQLFNSRAEINFSNKIFWTTFLQYNTQRNNFNINSRLQYRYKPMSDFFLVFTDNYLVDPSFKNRNRAVVFKWNYWLTL